MIVRQLHPQELSRADFVRAVAFEGNWEEKTETVPEAEKPNADLCYATLSDDGLTVYGCLSVVSRTVRFDGHDVPLGGIGGVATLPQFRRGGVVRACLGAALRDMYQHGQVFSFLYPFSTAFYHQFGYEPGAAVHTWTLPIRDLQVPDVGGQIEMLRPGDSLAPLLDIYRHFYVDYNLSAVRDTYDAELEKENWLNRQRYIYLWRDSTGQVRSFLTLHKGEGGVMDCTNTFAMRNDFLFTDLQSLQALLHFVRHAFIANYSDICIQMPADINLLPLLHEVNSAQCRRHYNGMLRVTNVAQALRLCCCKGSGSLRIAVDDPQIAENTATWQIDFTPGQANAVRQTQEPPDVSLTIADFSALICGTHATDDLNWMPQVQVHRPEAPLDQIFYAKKCLMTDLF